MNKKPLKNSLEKVIAGIENRSSDWPSKVILNTGFCKLDYCLFNGRLTIITSIPSITKKALALDITRNLALNGMSIGYISMGESEGNLISRILSSLAKVDLWKIRIGKISSEELSSIKIASKKIADASIFISDVSSPTVKEVIDIARKMDGDHKLDLLIIDYLQLIEGADGGPESVDKITGKIKSLAQKLNIPILLLVQMNSIPKKKSNNLKILRKIGNFEKNSDSIIFMNESEEPENNKVELLIDHSSFCDIGKMDIIFDPLLYTFSIPVNQVDNIVEAKPPVKFLSRLEEACRNLIDKIIRL
jgi:replicative DNA helicase